jgi:hypothetical protein
MYNVHNSQITWLDTYFRDNRNAIHLFEFHVTETLIAHLSTHYAPLPHKRNHQNGVRQTNTVEEETPQRRDTYELESPDVDKITLNAWRNAGQPVPETAWFVVFIHSQVCIINNCEKHIIKAPNTTNDICRKFRQRSGTIQHAKLQVVC